MGIRDIALFILVFGAIPFILKRPWIGALFWAWIGLMNPHRLSWGIAHDFPFAQVIAIATIAGFFITSDERRFKGGAAVILLIAFVLWTCVTTLFAFHPESAVPMLERVLKVQIMGLLVLVLLNDRKQIEWFVLVITLSIAFFGIKGGFFTLLHAGSFRVWGPPNTFIEDNNSIALAQVMVIPLLFHLLRQAERGWLKAAFLLSVGLCAAAALGTHSRGALLAIGAMAVFLWWRAPRKVVTGLGLAVAGSTLIAMMPAQWEDRMATITEYREDASAMGRINAWTMAWNVAVDRPFVGGGFELYTPDVFRRYAPVPEDLHSAHSIYFQVLGEHGFVGLTLFLLVWLSTWRTASWIRKQANLAPGYEWARSLAGMAQVSLIAYAVGGAFLNLAYWDFPYFILVLLVATRALLRRELEAIAEGACEPQTGHQVTTTVARGTPIPGPGTTLG